MDWIDAKQLVNAGNIVTTKKGEVFFFIVDNKYKLYVQPNVAIFDIEPNDKEFNIVKDWRVDNSVRNEINEQLEKRK